MVLKKKGYLNMFSKISLDNDVIRTLQHTKVALPGRMIVLRVLVNTMHTKICKQIAEKLLKNIRQVNTHKHKWKMTAHNESQVNEICACGDHVSRPATKEERKAFKLILKKMLSKKREDNVHFVWHKFCNYFFNTDKTWKWLGYDLMCKVRKWADKYPDEVIITLIDDNHYMSSSLVFIAHSTKIKYHGTTVISIPQMGDIPGRFFMYPGHHDAALAAMIKIKKAAKGLEVYGIKNGWKNG